MKRLALLICDVPMAPVVAKYGTYYEIFLELLRQSLPTSDAADLQEDIYHGQPRFSLDAYDVQRKQEYPPDEVNYDAVIMTGSAASAYENLDWINKLIAYTRRIAEEKPRTKIYGICFGHQIVARAFGEECVPNNGIWELGIAQMRLTDVGKKIFGADVLNIQQMHRDHVPNVPPTFHLLGSTKICQNQGMVRFYPPDLSPSSATLKDVHIITLQGHPEYIAQIVRIMVDTRAEKGVIDAQTAELARETAQLKNDGIDVIGRLLWEILGTV